MLYNALMRIALTADLHWGQNRVGDEATRGLVAFLHDNPPDLLLLGGDQGTQHHFDECLALFAEFDCPKALVPGNHDIWVEDNDSRGDSLAVYETHLPNVCRQHGFHYLDRAPLIASPSLAIAGTMNWYDYSWSIERLTAEFPGNEWRLKSKMFTRGRHNDGRFVRWPLSDADFTNRVVATFSEHLADASAQAEKVLVITHHPPVYGLGFPRDKPPATLDGLIWDAFSGNTTIERLLTEQTAKVPYLFCGHTHRERQHQLDATVCHNIGGDYHFKRLLILDFPAGDVEPHVFGNPVRQAM